MDKLPFSIYDFFGYLAAGYVTLIGVAAAFVGDDSWTTSPGAIVGVLLIVLAYSVGHVVANVSGYLIERKLVGDWLKTPSVNLFRDAAPSGFASKMLPGYFTPLPAGTRTRVTEKVGRMTGGQLSGTALFFHCFARVKDRDPVLNRLNTFLNLYGFCRNMSVALAIVGLALTIGSVVVGSAHTGRLVAPGWCAAGSFAFAIGLLYRYLKFYRHYAVEVFISYAEQD